MNSEFRFALKNHVYKNTTFAASELISTTEPKSCMFLDKANHPKSSGVYIIFSPNIVDFAPATNGEGCIYVGEGQINQRLYQHWYNERFGSRDKDYIVVYYKIPDQVDRKAVERILIKHYNPPIIKKANPS